MLSGLTDSIAIAEPGVNMPRLGFGTYRSNPGRETEQAVLWALETGYRSIDTASLYGNEESVGLALKRSGLPRDDIFIATKVWNDEQGYEGTLAAFERGLVRLDTSYVDLYLVHWAIPHLMRDTWRAMEELVTSGRTRAIGVCNHLVHHLEALSRFATIPPAVDQVEFHPRLQRPDLQHYCGSKAIAIEAWAPIMRGGVTTIPEIETVAQRHGRTAAQVSLRWILQKGHVAIPKSVHVERIRENADVFGFELTDAEMATLDSLDTGQRIGPDPDRFS